MVNTTYPADAVEAACVAVCKTGKRETGQGTCSLLCMDQLGDVRKWKCRRAMPVHGSYVQAALTAADEVMAAKGWNRVQWQPIETAPKMKTVLLFAIVDAQTGNWKIATGFWHTGYEGLETTSPWCWDGHQVRSHEVQPTHWQPLSDPPAMYDAAPGVKP